MRQFRCSLSTQFEVYEKCTDIYSRDRSERQMKKKRPLQSDQYFKTLAFS